MPPIIESPAYRALKVATVVMGVLIVAGTLTLAVLVVGRLSGTAPGHGPTRLVEPPGSRIAGIAAADGRLFVHVTGGGTPDRVRVFSTHLLPDAGVEFAPQ